jgi:hypothetical protein
MDEGDSKTTTNGYEELAPTSNNLADILRWLSNGHVVILHTGKINKKSFFLELGHVVGKRRVFLPHLLDDHSKMIFVNVSYMPSLLDDGEWEWYIVHANRKNIHSNNNETGFRELEHEKQYDFLLEQEEQAKRQKLFLTL